MKYISQHSDRLQEARDKIAELEAENKRLRGENVVLRARAMTRPAPVPNPVHTERPNFTASTASSRQKEKNVALPNDKPRKAVHVNGKPYIYVDGVPIFCGNPIHARSRFMDSTEASRYRLWANIDDRQARLLRTTTTPRSCRKPQTSEWQYGSDSGYDSPSTEPVSIIEQGWQIEEPSSQQFSESSEKESDDTPGLAERTRLDDSLDGILHIIMTNSETNLRYLRKAAKIVQTSIWHAWKNGMGYIGADFADGPHLIGLGRNELLEWVSRSSASGWRAYNAMMAVVEMRNTISHPNGWELRRSCIIDDRLERAQKLCVELGDEDGAIEVRKLRDALHADVQDTLQRIMAWHHLVVLSHSEALDIEPHHIKMLEKVLDHWEFWEHRGSEELKFYRTLYEVAQSWVNHRNE
ncbi:hypothetical protein F5B22DRAFT_656947 [Xylaria bambusicola]|uniref:uncharacterized protein n=1 Tax=Xylaria bambusicola TaxID=326684 RepID=UPI0020080E23|nr:uncharacterized protein F5B22DRAFT_656947 [Xylaria bambusicola]KAI0513229.1 hypothetical protein F5B22DRAFT_656947 [Xylaria bambusicola]